MCDDKPDQIKFNYDINDKLMKFYVKDAKSRDSLVKLIPVLFLGTIHKSLFLLRGHSNKRPLLI